MTASTTTFDIARVSRAIEARDASAQVELYAQGATVTIADRAAQPSSPRVLRGREEIAAWVQDTCSREMIHAVKHAVQDEHGAAYVVACSYADGTKVLCSTVLELEQGLITEQTVVQVWDEV
jgi:SnoaL-like domain